MLLQIFAPLSSLLKTKTTKDAPAAKTDNDKKRVFLNSAPVTDIKEREIIVLGSSGVKKDQAMKQELKNGNVMQMNADGSSIVRDASGKIIKSCDVTRTTREFKHDEQTGALMVKRFGLWTTPDDARIDENGTLYFTRDGVEIEERLSGLHIQTNKEKGITIQTHHHNNFELVKMANGEIWKRETARDKESFVIWKKGKLSFKSETYFELRAMVAETPNGKQSLYTVSRYEQSWSHGALTREKYLFKNKLNGKREMKIALQLGTGNLMLKNVASLVTTFENGETKDATYELAEPTSFRIDIPNTKCTLENIVKIRNFAAGLNLGLCFESKDGDEYVVFVGARGIDNRERAAAAAAELDEFAAEGVMHADLVLR